MTDLAQRIARLTPAQRAVLAAKLRPAPERAVDLAAEAALDPDIVPADSPAACGGEPERVFLTGATGFLGTYLLHELLARTDAEIHCLVRAGSAGEAAGRLRDGLARYGLEKPEPAARIVPVPGDLSQPRFGLDEGRFRELGDAMDWVLHNGALVNFVYPYARLKAANVLGTGEALRLACLVRTKPFHYVSTLSVFGNEAPSLPEGFAEEDSVGADAALDDGYAQSKWVAEAMVKSAAARGLPTAIYRPAAVTGDSRTGAWNTEDFFCRLLKGCILLRAVPDLPAVFNLVPVDFAGKALVLLAKQASSLGRTFHLDSGSPLSAPALIEWTRDFGYALAPQDFGTWRRRLRAACAASPDHPLLPVLPVFDDPAMDPDRGAGPAGNRFDCRATLARLEAAGMGRPKIDRALMHGYFREFVRTGFLPEPGA